ncbi:TPA: hypothetical protein ACGOPE_001847, partial [Streptococcus suis]
LGKVVREEAISVGLWPWPEQAAYSRRTNHQFDWWFYPLQSYRAFCKYFSYFPCIFFFYMIYLTG